MTGAKRRSFFGSFFLDQIQPKRTPSKSHSHLGAQRRKVFSSPPPSPGGEGGKFHFFPGSSNGQPAPGNGVTATRESTEAGRPRRRLFPTVVMSHMSSPSGFCLDSGIQEERWGHGYNAYNSVHLQSVRRPPSHCDIVWCKSWRFFFGIRNNDG